MSLYERLNSEDKKTMVASWWIVAAIGGMVGLILGCGAGMFIAVVLGA